VKKKLIEVALPLDKINAAAAREKSIRHGHPATLHLWWARRPLAACRAVIFASLIDDPSAHPDRFPTEADQQIERDRLFVILEQLVQWENSNNELVLAAARKEILKSTGGKPPAIYDPFCGGGSIPLEAQRLGLESYGSDLNPVPVIITKATTEIPQRFGNRPPVNPVAKLRQDLAEWQGAKGLADDVRYYGNWIRSKAWERIGYLYPTANLPKEIGGGHATVIAWLWARTVRCPNPACGAQMLLVRTFALSTKKGKETWIEPLVDKATRTVSFQVRSGDGTVPSPPKLGRGAKFRCLICEETAPDEHIKTEGAAGRMSVQLLAIVADTPGSRIYLSPDAEHAQAAKVAVAESELGQELANDPRNLWCIPYGLRRFRDLFTSRQLVALTTFSDLVSEAREQALLDGASVEYANAIATYLGLLVSRTANTVCSLAVWSQGRDQSVNVFSRQALPMNWDFPEVNPFAGAAGDFGETADSMAKVIEAQTVAQPAHICQDDATQPAYAPLNPLRNCSPPPVRRDSRSGPLSCAGHRRPGIRRHVPQGLRRIPAALQPLGLRETPHGRISDPPGYVRESLQRLGEPGAFPAHARRVAADGVGDPQPLGQ
jgi:putative DNA methylase